MVDFALVENCDFWPMIFVLFLVVFLIFWEFLELFFGTLIAFCIQQFLKKREL